MSDDPRQLLRAMFDAAVGAAHPSVCLPQYLERITPPKGRTVVIGAGKAAASMAAAVEKHWKGGPLEGLVVTRYEHGAPTSQIEVIEASHPVPDAAGREAAKRILQKVQGLTEDDLVLALISGGGSALMALPAEGVTLEEKQAVNKALLKSGANISEMNCVRKHLSAIKGGRLARAAAPARVVALMISDVPNDDLSVIASGPTVPDPTTREDALAVIAKYRIDAPKAVLDHLSSPDCETPKPGDAIFNRVENILIATPQGSLDAAAAVARGAGYTPCILGDLEGESRDVALVHAGIAKQIAIHGQPFVPPGRHHLRRRDDRHRARQWQGRARRGIPARPDAGAGRLRRHFGHRLRHGRHRRRGDQRRRHDAARQFRPRPGQGRRSQGALRQ